MKIFSLEFAVNMKIHNKINAIGIVFYRNSSKKINLL